jgi:hypothetical protein
LGSGFFASGFGSGFFGSGLGSGFFRFGFRLLRFRLGRLLLFLDRDVRLPGRRRLGFRLDLGLRLWFGLGFGLWLGFRFRSGFGLDFLRRGAVAGLPGTAGAGRLDHNSTATTSGWLRFHCTPRKSAAISPACTRMVNARALFLPGSATFSGIIFPSSVPEGRRA